MSKSPDPNAEILKNQKEAALRKKSSKLNCLQVNPAYTSV